MDVACFEIPLLQPAARRAHLAPCAFEIIGVDEFDGAVSDHLGRIVTENDLGARTDLDEISGGIGHEDEVMRGLEDAPPFLDLLIECPFRPLAVGNVARDLGDADDFAD